ncbi:hypothetical protein D3C78_1346090 [compost metagenome]
MSTNSGNLTFVHNDNSIGIQYRTNPLRNEDDRRFPGLRLQCGTQLRIRLEIQCGEAVVKNVNFSAAHKRTCNRETLLLTTRDVIPALRDYGLVSLFHFSNEISSLCNSGSMLYFFIRRILFTVTNIVADRT